MFDGIRARYHFAGLYVMLVRSKWRELRDARVGPPPFDLAREISDDGWRCHVAENRRLFGDEVVDEEIAATIAAITCDDPSTCTCLRCSYIRIFGEDTPRV